MEPKKEGITKFSKGLIAGAGSLILVGGGLLGGYQIEKQSAKPNVKYVEVVVTPTALPTASPSATLAPAKTFIRSIGGVTAPVTKAAK